MKKKDAATIAILDIGTNKVSCIVGKILPDESIEIIAHCQVTSSGVKKGVVVNIELTVSAINDVLKLAEKEAQISIKAVYASLSGSHINAINSHGIVAIRNQKEVARSDVDRVIEAARAVQIPSDQKVLHVLPQEFIIDKQDGIHNPVGMSGVRLEADVHLITSSSSAVQNIIKCIESCDVQVNDIVFNALATSKAVVTQDEKDLGVCVVDMGAGTTDIVIYIDGTIKHSAVIPIAGDQVTNDLAVALRTSTNTAEKIKVSNLFNLNDLDSIVDVPGVVDGQQQVAKKTMIDVVEARYEELLGMIASEIKKADCYHSLSAGIVITGGACKVDWLDALAKRVCNLPIRMALPSSVMTNSELDESDSVGVGLLLHGKDQFLRNQGLHNRSSTGNILLRLTRWLQYHF